MPLPLPAILCGPAEAFPFLISCQGPHPADFASQNWTNSTSQRFHLLARCKLLLPLHVVGGRLVPHLVALLHTAGGHWVFLMSCVFSKRA